MPLPLNTPLSLQGPSDAVQTKPKQAILVKLTLEALDALEAAATSGGTPKLQVEFGDKPGIFINGKCYPVRAQQENAAHELYVRTITGNKPSAALKLSAAVTGQFLVQPRGNDTSRDDVARVAESDISSRLQERRREEQEKREKSKIQMLDFPPDLKPLGKKKNKPSLDANAAPTTSRPKASSPLPPPNASRATPPVVRDNPDVRRRLIRFLADKPGSSAEEILARVGGKAASAEIHASITSMLSEVAESSTQGKTSTWTLKPRTWLDVRPYEWPGLLDRDRERLATEASKMLTKLRIPRTDPAWAHLRDPNAAPPSSTTTTGSSATQVSGQRPHGLPAKPDVTNGTASTTPRVGVAGGSTTTAAAKAKTAAKSATTSGATKTKARDVPITAKDEGARATRSEGTSTKVVRKAVDPARAERYDDTSETDGSTSRVKRLPVPGKEARKVGSPLPPSRLPPSSSTSSQDRDRPRVKHERTESASKPRRDAMDVDGDDRRKAAPLPRPAPAPPVASQERVRAHPMKRKSSEEGELEDSEPGEVVVPTKRRRMDDAAESSARPAKAERDLKEGKSRLMPSSSSTPTMRRPSPAAQPVAKAPPAKHSREMSSSTTTSSVRGEREGRRTAPTTTTSTKRRRENISYTSSSDDDDDGDVPLQQTVKKVKPRAVAEPPRAASPSAPAPRPKVKVKSESSSSTTKRAASPPPPRPKVKTEASERGRSPLPPPQQNGKIKSEGKPSKPRSRNALRARYTKLYSRYLIKYGRVAQHKERAQRLLEGGSDSDDEDSDGSFLDAEELRILVNEMKREARELERVKKEFEEMSE